MGYTDFQCCGVGWDDRDKSLSGTGGGGRAGLGKFHGQRPLQANLFKLVNAWRFIMERVCDKTGQRANINASIGTMNFSRQEPAHRLLYEHYLTFLIPGWPDQMLKSLSQKSSLLCPPDAPAVKLEDKNLCHLMTLTYQRLKAKAACLTLENHRACRIPRAKRAQQIDKAP